MLVGSLYQPEAPTFSDIMSGAILTTLDGVTKVNETTKDYYTFSVPFYFSTVSSYRFL